MMEYIGVFDHKESDTFRPTVEKRMHVGSSYQKTITARDGGVAI